MKCIKTTFERLQSHLPSRIWIAALGVRNHGSPPALLQTGRPRSIHC